MAKMGITHVQSALGLILALQDGKVEEELRTLSESADENNLILAKAIEAQESADKTMADALDVKAEYERQLSVVNDLREEHDKRSQTLDEAADKLKADRKKHVDEYKAFHEKSTQQAHELEERLANTKKLEQQAKANSEKSASIRAELEDRQAKLQAAMAG